MRLLTLHTVVFLTSAVLASGGTGGYLFGCRPDGGLLGLTLDKENQSTVISHIQNGFPQIHQAVEDMSYSWSSNGLILELNKGEGERALVFGKICGSGAGGSTAVELLPNTQYLPLGVLGTCWSCGLYAFTLYESEIYFLVRGDYDDGNGEQLHLRVLQPCSQCQVNAHPELFNISWHQTINCSRIIANIRETNLIADEMMIVTPLALKVIKQNDQIAFLVHTRRFLDSEAATKVFLTLYYVTMGGSVSALHTVELPAEHYASRQMPGMGSIDFKDGLVCWSTFDRVLCGDLLGNTISKDVRQALPPLDGYIHNICTGNDSRVLVLVSGVAIAIATDKAKAIYFGCYSGNQFNGGVGLVTAGAGWIGRNVTRVRESSSDKNLIAGSLLFLDQLPSSCINEFKPLFCHRDSTNSPPLPRPDDTDASGNGDENVAIVYTEDDTEGKNVSVAYKYSTLTLLPTVLDDRYNNGPSTVPIYSTLTLYLTLLIV